jgi:conjugal transfer pilus assembly protein TraD
MDSPGTEIDIDIPDAFMNRHVFGFGTTGVGKSRLIELIVEQEIRKGRSVIYIDPKGDQQLFTKIFQVTRETDRLSELQLITPIFPEYSATLNPLAYSFMSDELVSHVTSGIDVKDNFYRDVAKLIIIPVINGQIILARDQGMLPELTFMKIFEEISLAKLGQLRNALSRVGSDDAKYYALMLDQVLSWTPDHYTKVSTTLINTLVTLTGGNIGKIIGHADSNRLIQRLEENKPVVAVVHTGSMLVRDSASILGRVLLSMVQGAIGRAFLSSKQVMKPGLTLVIDEAQSALTKESIDLFAKGGSADLRVIAFAQSVNQIYDALGDEIAGRTALDNSNTKIFMRCSDAETSKYVVEHFGTRTVLQGILGNNAITSRQVEQDVLKTQNILDLQPQEFYLMTYSGRFKGRTLDVAIPNVKIRFPDAPASQTNLRRASGVAP